MGKDFLRDPVSGDALSGRVIINVALNRQVGVLPKLYQAVLFYVLWATYDRTSCDFCKMFGN